MSRFFPHTQNVEEQPLYKTLLTFHVLHRAFQTGAGAGLLYAGGRTLRRNSNRAANVAATAAGMSPVLRSVAVGGLAGTGLLGVALPLYMKNQTEIQWRDRSWRLLESESQVEVDDWSLAGTAVGAVATAARSSMFPSGRVMRIVGGAGIGNLAGVTGYMIYRYGVHQGKR